jgi:hypothetical protein
MKFRPKRLCEKFRDLIGNGHKQDRMSKPTPKRYRRNHKLHDNTITSRFGLDSGLSEFKCLLVRPNGASRMESKTIGPGQAGLRSRDLRPNIAATPSSSSVTEDASGTDAETTAMSPG